MASFSRSLDFRDWQDGALLARVPLADAAVARWGAPYYNVHRADLHAALRGALGEQHLTLGARCVAVEQDGAKVTIGFADGRHATGDLLIGADGIHSVVREYVAGPDLPTWWPQIAWRGLAPAAVGHDGRAGDAPALVLGARKQFVTYYVAAGRLINWVGSTPSDGWREESWSARGDRDEALVLFDGWHPQVRALIAGTEQIFKWALFDRPPLETWTRGRVTLLGDAAHPMLPFLGQGAGQSIEDGLVLARCLVADRDDPERGLDAYAAGRRRVRPRCKRASRDAGRGLQARPGVVDARNARMRADPDAQVALGSTGSGATTWRALSPTGDAHPSGPWSIPALQGRFAEPESSIRLRDESALQFRGHPLRSAGQGGARTAVISHTAETRAEQNDEQRRSVAPDCRR